MWYNRIGDFFKKYSSYGIYLALFLSVINALLIKNEKGEYIFEYTSIKAIVNFLFVFIIIVFAIINKYYQDKGRMTREEERRRELDNVCENVFSTLKLDHTFRVSVFEMRGDCLEVTGRFSKFESHPTSKVRFKSNVGCVGIAYYAGAKHIIDDLPDFETSPEEYYKKMRLSGNMNEEDIDRLHRKNRSYFSFPIKYFNSQKVAAVLCIDCTDAYAFSKNQGLIEQVDNMISPLFSTFFEVTGAKG
jgi:hypothetical protein